MRRYFNGCIAGVGAGHLSIFPLTTQLCTGFGVVLVPKIKFCYICEMKKTESTFAFLTGLLLAFGIYDSLHQPQPGPEHQRQHIYGYWQQVGQYIQRAMYGER